MGENVQFPTFGGTPLMFCIWLDKNDDVARLVLEEEQAAGFYTLFKSENDPELG